MMEQTSLEWSPWGKPFPRYYKDKKSTTPSSTYNFLVWSGIILLIIFLILITFYSIKVRSQDNYQLLYSEFNPKMTSIELPNATQIVENSHPILSGIWVVMKFSLIIIAIIMVIWSCSIMTTWISDEIIMRVKLFKVFGLFKSGSLAKINL